MPRSLSLSYRIIGIEWTVKNGKPFQLSPKKPRKHKTKKSKRATSKRGGSRASGSGGPDAAAALDGSHPHLDASAAAAPTHSEQSPKKLVGTAKGKGKEKDVGKRRAYVRVVTSLGGSLNLELFCEKAGQLPRRLFGTLLTET